MRVKIVLMLIILLAAFLRFYKLSTVPPSLNWDEVAMGYNAYSILETGKDEFGTSFPKYFRSLDDYKRPAYLYALVPTVALFGLTDFAVRFPSALFGTLTVLLVYFLAKEVFKNDKVALISAGILAILPWHIQFAHAAFEATLGVFFTGLGVLAFLWGVKKSSWWLPISALSFGLALYSYLGQRGVVPVLTVILVLMFAKKLLSKARKSRILKLSIGLFLLITGIFWTSLLFDMTGPEGTIRYKATNIFEHNEERQRNFDEIMYDGTLGINIPRRILHHSGIVGLELITRGYLVHFSPDFFFFDLGQQHHHAPRMGIVYIWMLPFMLYGIYYIIQKYRTKEMFAVWVWLLATPIAASVTFQIPHALRVADMIIPVTFIISVGLYGVFRIVSSYKRQLIYPFGFAVAGTALFFLFQFFHQYFIHLPQERSADWVYGRKEMVQYAEANKNKYDKIIASTKLEFPHIFFLYYTKYDPKKYLAQGGTKSGSWDEERNKYDKYEFHKFEYAKDRNNGNYLFIGSPDEFPEDVKPLKVIQYLNGKPAMYIVES